MGIPGNQWKIRENDKMDNEKDLLDFLINDKTEVNNDDLAIQIITASTYESIVDVVNEKIKGSSIKPIN